MPEQAFFFYKNHKITAPKNVLTGAEIKSLIQKEVPAFDPAHVLVLEGHGHEQDREIKDTDQVPVEIGHGEGPKHFFSKPPTNFGGK